MKEASIDLELAHHYKNIASDFSAIAEMRQVNQTTLTRRFNTNLEPNIVGA
jgi:hypothetical protein